MKALRIAVVLIVLGYARAYAVDVWYLGLEGDRALLRDTSGRVHRLEVGDLFSDLGMLVLADDKEAVFEVAVSDEEREQLHARGWFAPDMRRASLPLYTGD